MKSNYGSIHSISKRYDLIIPKEYLDFRELVKYLLSQIDSLAVKESFLNDLSYSVGGYYSDVGYVENNVYFVPDPFCDKFIAHYKRLLSVRPGLTLGVCLPNKPKFTPVDRVILEDRYKVSFLLYFFSLVESDYPGVSSLKIASSRFSDFNLVVITNAVRREVSSPLLFLLSSIFSGPSVLSTFKDKLFSFGYDLIYSQDVNEITLSKMSTGDILVDHVDSLTSKEKVFLTSLKFYQSGIIFVLSHSFDHLSYIQASSDNHLPFDYLEVEYSSFKDDCHMYFEISDKRPVVVRSCDIDIVDLFDFLLVSNLSAAEVRRLVGMIELSILPSRVCLDDTDLVNASDVITYDRWESINSTPSRIDLVLSNEHCKTNGIKLFISCMGFSKKFKSTLSSNYTFENVSRLLEVSRDQGRSMHEVLLSYVKSKDLTYRDIESRLKFIA
ncbi:hypothetical protein [Photobacterium leiognathi]|uniref:hypothetical protein n=1 Tax=Photobacterium leiognathi TaxID=553611 RepID=UPI002981C135|nr:hypothetical protein [Photobacterium leiognathi]